MIYQTNAIVVNEVKFTEYIIIIVDDESIVNNKNIVKASVVNDEHLVENIVKASVVNDEHLVENIIINDLYILKCLYVCLMIVFGMMIYATDTNTNTTNTNTTNIDDNILFYIP